MARAALGLSAADLANKASVGYATVARFETGANIADNTKGRIETALRDAGASFEHRAGRVGVTVPA